MFVCVYTYLHVCGHMGVCMWRLEVDSEYLPCFLLTFLLMQALTEFRAHQFG